MFNKLLYKVVNLVHELTATPKSMRHVILRGIRTALIELGSATKVELSEKLGISFPTISKFLAEMEKEGELLLLGLDDSSGGRRAKRYAYNPEHMLGLAIFLERTETNYTIFNCLGEVMEQGVTSTVPLEDQLSIVTECVEDLLSKYPKISSMSIGVPGSVHHGRIIYIPGYEHLEQFDLKGHFEERFALPVVVENDMNAAVLGYYRTRRMKNNPSLIYLYFGQNGPGAGIMMNGDVVRGSTFFSGEVSFVPQYDDRNFGQALETGRGPKHSVIHDKYQIDAVSRLVASFVAILNPHAIIFCQDEVNQSLIDHIVRASSNYIPKEHLPNLITSDWKQDYLDGLQSLGLDLMITRT